MLRSQLERKLFLARQAAAMGVERCRDCGGNAGCPVVLGVDYKPGASGGTLGTDHWVCLTRRDPKDEDVYYANDPASGGGRSASGGSPMAL